MSTPDDHVITEPAREGLTGVPAVALVAGGLQLALLAVPSLATAAGASEVQAALVLGAAELVLVLAIGLTLVRSPLPLAGIGTYALLLIVLVGISVFAWLFVEGVWAGAVTLALAVALLAYTVHRYQVVATELGEPGGAGP